MTEYLENTNASLIGATDEGASGTTSRKRPGDSADRIFEQLSSDILSGKLAEGDKLNEPQLAQQFETSRSPVREAIRRLVERQLVTHQPNFGVRVTTFAPERIIELYQIREMEEGLAARLATDNLEERDLARLKDILHFQQLAWEKTDPGDEDYLEANREFHRIIHERSKNQVLITRMQDSWYKLPALWRRQHSDRAMRGQAAIDEHWQILHALQRRDGELAEIQMRRHISSTRKCYEALMAQV